MNVQEIVLQLANYQGNKQELVSQLWEEVRPLCKTQTSGLTDEVTSLWDWLYNGDYTGNETAESIAAEWDSLSEN